jgi:ubiquinone/menaquinone biosynthesis C-methylase UbiE
MDERIDRTRRTYDEIAGRFLENTRDRTELSPWLDRFAEYLGSGAMVLDLGSGAGCDSAELRRLGLRAVSLDLSLGMLKAGVPEFPGPRLQADACHIPLRDRSVAGVWANASLVHLSSGDAETALREARRVLAPSGLLHVSVKSGQGAEWESARYGRARWFQYWSAAELDALLARAGFVIIASWRSSKANFDWLVRHATAPRDRSLTGMQF